jgi:hypothetical protein
VRARYVPRIPKGVRGPPFYARGRVKKSQYEFRRRARLKTLQKACTPMAHDLKTEPVKCCVEIFYWLGFFKDDRLKSI